MKKTVAMMQPYLFPYLGYFQLIQAADEFVLGDNLQFSKQGWINRNRVIIGGNEKLVVFPLRHDSHRCRINERVFADVFAEHAKAVLVQIRLSYRGAVSFHTAYPLIESLVLFEETNLARYAENAIRRLCEYLSISTPIHVSSELKLDVATDKQDRVVKGLKRLRGDVYINPIGGMALYDAHYFRQHGAEIWFHRFGDVRYNQRRPQFIPCLSIIDVLMHNSRDALLEHLHCYTMENHEGVRCTPDEFKALLAAEENSAVASLAFPQRLIC